MSPTNCWNLRVTAEVNQGGRRYMEDVTAVQFERAKDARKVVEYAAFAIFDGHGGKEAALFARDNVLENIKKQKGFFSNDTETVKKAISNGFLITHQQMWNQLPKWPKTSNGHPSTAGTTASLVVIRRNKMYVANVGDSMVVMGTRDYCNRNNPRAFQAMELTVDHKPELPEERKRIEQCGGCVMNKSGVNRVVWNRPKLSHNGPIRRSTKLDKIPFLAIARSLGDLWSYNSALDEFIVSPVPDVHVYDLLQERDQFIILASDGLWNMVRPYESVTSAGTFEDRKKKKIITGTPAHELVQLALDRWKMRQMRADNTSVIVVYIERKKIESEARKHGTYTESWTSATTEADKVNSPQPVIMLDKESTSEESLNLPGVSNMPAEHSLPKPIPVIATRVPLLGQPQVPELVENSVDNRSDTPELELFDTSTVAKDPEPLQDSSISSSSGDLEDDSKSFKPIPKLVRSNRVVIDCLENSLNADRVFKSREVTVTEASDEPSSSIINLKPAGNHKEKDEEIERKGVRTRKQSNDIEASLRRMTRSSGSLHTVKDTEKRGQKRRKSEDSLSSTAKNRRVIRSSNALRSKFSKSAQEISKKTFEVSKTKIMSPVTGKIGELMKKTVKKSSIPRRKSEPISSSKRRSARVIKSSVGKSPCK